MADDALPSPNFDKKPEGSFFREGGGGGSSQNSWKVENENWTKKNDTKHYLHRKKYVYYYFSGFIQFSSTPVHGNQFKPKGKFRKIPIQKSMIFIFSLL